MVNIEEFKKLVNVKFIEKDGDIYCGKLNLCGRKDITELPDNLKVLGGLDLRQSSITKLPKGLEVEEFLDISGTEVEELPEDTKFGSSLFLEKMKKPFSFPKVVKVNSVMGCYDTNIKRMPEELYVEDDCNFSGSTFDKLPKVMGIRGSLLLRETAITELPEGLKEVYGRLSISNTKVTNLPDNLVVHDGLNFNYTLIKELPKDLIVGYGLNLGNDSLMDYSNLHKVCSNFITTEEKYNEIKDTLPKHSKKLMVLGEVFITFEPNYKGAYLFENENGKYIDVDNIFGKLIEQKGNVYHVKLGKSKDIIYLVTDGNGHWAHGVTLDEAKADLLFKISEKNKDGYKDLTLDSELSFNEAIVCYRVITGACFFGTNDFIKNRLSENKKEVYTIKEIIDLTKGEYGSGVFRDFFCKG